MPKTSVPAYDPGSLPPAAVDGFTGSGGCVFTCEYQQFVVDTKTMLRENSPHIKRKKLQRAIEHMWLATHPEEPGETVEAAHRAHGKQPSESSSSAMPKHKSKHARPSTVNTEPDKPSYINDQMQQQAAQQEDEWGTRAATRGSRSGRTGSGPRCTSRTEAVNE